MVAVGGARLPHGRLLLERTDHRIPGQRLLQGEHGVDVGQAGLVAQEPPDRDGALAGRLELRPVLSNRCVDVEVAALGEEVGAGCGGALGGGEHELQRVFGVRGAGLAIRQPAPEVDDLATAHVHGRRGADLAVLLEVGAERLGHPLEPGLDRAPDLRHAVPPRGRSAQAGTRWPLVAHRVQGERGVRSGDGNPAATPEGDQLLAEEDHEEHRDRDPGHGGPGRGAVVVAEHQAQADCEPSEGHAHHHAEPDAADEQRGGGGRSHEEAEHEQRAHRLERRHDGDGDEGQQGQVRGPGRSPRLPAFASLNDSTRKAR